MMAWTIISRCCNFDLIHSETYLITAIADCLMTNTTTRSTESPDAGIKRVLDGFVEGMRWVMAMITVSETDQAEVKVCAILAVDEISAWEHCKVVSR